MHRIATKTASCLLLFPFLVASALEAEETPLHRDAIETMKKAATYFREQVATHGGYVYHYSLDLKQRWGEGVATEDQIWVQPPGTPTVGLALLDTYHATGDKYYLDAATDAAEALVYGQLRSGGWTNCVDFDPHGSRVADYRNGKGGGKNNSSLDDGQTQSAIRLLMHVDQAHGFKQEAIHNAATIALEALLAAQFPNGGFPQVWTGPVEERPVVEAAYPDYDWRREGRIKEYWAMYTLNDNVCGYVTDTLIDAYQIYGNERNLTSLRKLGDFLLLAQMPAPQPAWAQQYNTAMQPIWARRFEPPAIASDESQEAIATLLQIAEVTNDNKYLEPIPAALEYLDNSLLPDGQLARFYELRTNEPLYMQRSGRSYWLTYDDSDLPSHYGWKISAKIERLSQSYQALRRGDKKPESRPPSAEKIRKIINALDNQGRWVSKHDGERLVGQAKMPTGDRYLSSKVFSENLHTLSEYVRFAKTQRDKGH